VDNLFIMERFGKEYNPQKEENQKKNKKVRKH
jgi:hypothetical protein